MKKLFLGAFLALSAISSPAAPALSNPPHVTPVRWILTTRHNLNVDDRNVTLVGRITGKDDGSDWWFTDGTGSVRLDTGDLDLPVGRKLIIHGNIDQSRFGIGHLEVEVRRWNYAARR